MKNILTLTGLAAIMALTGCGGGGSDDPVAATSSKIVNVLNSDGTVYVTTCGTYIATQDFNGMSLCAEGTTTVNGFIGTDTSVYNASGALIGECTADFDISLLGTDQDVIGSCVLPAAAPAATSTSTSSTSTSSTSTTTSTTTDDDIDWGSANFDPDGDYETGMLNTSQQGAPTGGLHE